MIPKVLHYNAEGGAAVSPKGERVRLKAVNTSIWGVHPGTALATLKFASGPNEGEE